MTALPPRPNFRKLDEERQISAEVLLAQSAINKMIQRQAEAYNRDLETMLEKALQHGSAGVLVERWPTKYIIRLSLDVPYGTIQEIVHDRLINP